MLNAYNMLKVLCVMLKKPERRRRRSGVSIANFEYISSIVLLFPLLTFNK